MKSVCIFAVVSVCLFLLCASAVQAGPAGKAAQAARAAASAAKAASAPNPLDELYRPKYAYAGTNIPINAVPVSVRPAPGKAGAFSICTALRINRYWMITAAHCLERLGTQDHRVHADVEEISLTKKSASKRRGARFAHKTKGFEVAFSPVEEDNPANASLYFYRQGYSTDGSSPRIGYSFAEDIALIRLDEKDPSHKRARSLLRQTEEALGGGALAAVSAVYGGDMIQETEQRIAAAEAARKKFFGQKLNEYVFFVTPPEGTFHYKGRRGYGYFFAGPEKAGAKDRGFPQAYIYRFQGIKDRGSHELQWTSNGPQGISGSPIIMNRFVVSNTSGAARGYMQTPLYSFPFEEFLKRSMGAEYPSGKLCMSPILEGEVPVWQPAN